MTKDQLKEHISTLHLEGELQQSIAHLIDTAKEVDQKLLDTIADVLDLQAEFYEKTASLLEERAKTDTAVQGSPVVKTEDHPSSNGIVSTPTPEPVQTEPVQTT